MWIHICGSSLISKTFALTAAHCLPSQAHERMIRFGQPDLTKPDDDITGHVSKVSRYFPHPKYNQRAAYFDIALMQMATPIKQFNDFVSSICLPESPSQDLNRFSFHSAHVAGWGTLQRNGDKASDNLRAATLTIWPQR